MSIVISDNVVLGTAGVLPLSHPRIMWDSILRRGTLTASSELADFEAINAIDDLTFDFWRPSAMPATLEIELSEAEEIDYAFLAAHTIGTDGASVKVQQFVAEGEGEGEGEGGEWIDLTIEFAPGSDRVIAFLFDPVIGARFRFLFDGPVAPYIGVAMLGKALAVERRIYQGHTPITFGRRTVMRPQRSEGGALLGRSIVREGVATKIAFSNLTAAWIRETFSPFIDHARTIGTFGWAWRPDEFPAEVAFVWVSDDIQPTNAGPRDLMAVAFDVEGLIE